MKALFFAIVPVNRSEASRHYYGLPPQRPGDLDERVQMQPAKILIAAASEEGFFLYRFDENGSPAGDTWHRDTDELYDQALVEYGLPATAWLAIPPEQSEFLTAVDYASERARIVE